ncbi:MAG: hypothetical protein MJ069_00620 [Salinivirgaceae bacterium]|nr:hypothetical protein [Salinivirgaceae bacterium]
MISSVLGAFSSCKEDEQSVPFRVAFPPKYSVDMEGDNKGKVSRKESFTINRIVDGKENGKVADVVVNQTVKNVILVKLKTENLIVLRFCLIL